MYICVNFNINTMVKIIILGLRIFCLIIVFVIKVLQIILAFILHDSRFLFLESGHKYLYTDQKIYNFKKD